MSYDDRVTAFKAHIDAGGKVDAGDWMPDEYRLAALKFIEMHANSEVMGALPEGTWVPKAPTLKRKLSLTAKVQDEVGHGQILYRVAEDLGKSREAMFDDLVNGRTKFHNVFHYPAETWGDVAYIGWLIDGAAIVNQRALLDSSYLPYVRAMRRICAEESLHLRHGLEMVIELCTGTAEQRALFQDAVNRWWEPTMHFFGPPSKQKDMLLYWGIKTRTNESLRSEFFSTYVPKLWDLGISVPDDRLAWDAAAGDWQWSQPNWDMFWKVVSGHGPMTTVRLAQRKTVWDTHAWIREAFAGIPCGRLSGSKDRRGPVEVWDVFGKRSARDDWVLVGGVKGPDDAHMALLLARESYFRHKEGVAFAVRRRGSVSLDLIVDPESPEVIGGVTDRSYRRQEAYTGVGGRLRRASMLMAERGLTIDRPRPPDQRIRGDLEG